MRAFSIFLSLACVFSIFTASKALSSTEPLVIGIDADLSAVAVEGGIAITRGSVELNALLAVKIEKTQASERKIESARMNRLPKC